jgi:tetratricopeptide (TPR) repeat protein
MSSRREALTASRKKKIKKLLAGQQWAEARELYAEICRIDPKDYEAWLSLAELSIKLRALGDAEAAYKQAAALRPDEPKPCLNLGLLYKSHGGFVEAEQWLRRYMQLSPAGVAEYKRLGTDLQQRNILDLAVTIYRNVLQQTPNDVDTLNNLGVALQNSGQLDEALAALANAIKLQPKAHLYCNMANVYVDKGDYEQAHHCYQQALLLDPESVKTWGSLGAFYMGQMRLEEALASLDKAIAIDPGFAGAYWNRSLILLLQGNFKEGWREYDARFDSPDVVQRYGRREFGKPMWNGQPIPGKTLFVYAEQGFGDSLQFCRYLPLVQQRVEHMFFESRPELLRLMRTLSGGIECVARRDDFREPDLHFDYHIPLMSLPRIFNTEVDTIPAQSPYLSADPALVQQWGERIQNDGLKVGLVWAGSPTHQSNRYRSISLEQLAPLAQLTNITFYSLQKGPAAQQIATAPAGMKLVDLGAGITDFADTAAIIANLDLVISVDTSVAHLAGALGKPVWVMLYYPPEWRWQLDRNDSPWYPTMRLFRQDASRDWTPVLQQLVAALRMLTVSSI